MGHTNRLTNGWMDGWTDGRTSLNWPYLTPWRERRKTSYRFGKKREFEYRPRHRRLSIRTFKFHANESLVMTIMAKFDPLSVYGHIYHISHIYLDISLLFFFNHRNGIIIETRPSNLTTHPCDSIASIFIKLRWFSMIFIDFCLF